MLSFMRFFFIVINVALLAGCAMNAATGRSQFTGLMPSSSEASVGAEENQKVMQQYGVYENRALQAYVTRVGQRIAAQSERKDVQYTFTVLDSPVENAFALPGGYVYITRGLLALMNDEAELAGVLAHEMGHVTARHAAERYSQQVVGSLGLNVLGAVIGGGAGVNQALSTGANLFFSQYSQSQEYEADQLGVRYLAQAGYDPTAVSRFLNQLVRSDSLIKAQNGGQGDMPSLFSTHPPTASRVQRAATLAAQTSVQGGEVGRQALLQAIHGMAYGTSANEGFIRHGQFIHPDLGLAFAIPNGFQIDNQPERVVGKSQSGAAFIFDADTGGAAQGAGIYLVNWSKGKIDPASVTNSTVSGRPAATAELSGAADGRPVMVRLFAVNWGDGRVYRFLFLMPQGTSASEQAAMRNTAFSLRDITDAERNTAHGQQILLFQANAGDTVDSMAAKLPFEGGLNSARFRLLNGMDASEQVKAGSLYKIIR